MTASSSASWTTTLRAGPDVLSSAVAAGMAELVGVLDDGLCFVGVNAALVEALGTTAEALLGTSAADVVHPADQARMLLIFDLSERHGVAPGAAAYDLVRSDGSTLTVEMAGSEIEIDGQKLYCVVGRPTYALQTSHRLVDGLMAGLDLAEVVEPLLDHFGWREASNRVAITWADGHGMQAVSTGLPPVLAGIENRKAGEGRSALLEPWSEVMTSGQARRGTSEELLSPGVLAAAQDLDLRSLWIEPLRDDGTGDALITVWGGSDGYSPDIHAFAMLEAKRYLELVLQWHDQAQRLDIAANRDALTSLANRRVFFDRLIAGPGSGAVLFADLDQFKAVNDRWGHATGDDLLKQVASRILAAVRSNDLVARIGGDEFAVLLPDATVEEARAIAGRVSAVCADPFHVGPVEVTIGISVGLAHDKGELSEATLDAADRAQYEEKRRSRP